MKGKLLLGLVDEPEPRRSCEECHGETPHAEDILNEHTLKVACQTCHIPTYAKVNPTKMRWDWSTAGRLRDGKPYEEKDALGDDSYVSIKGSFVWGRNVKPEYVWFNGTASHYLLGDTVEDDAGAAQPRSSAATTTRTRRSSRSRSTAPASPSTSGTAS